MFPRSKNRSLKKLNMLVQGPLKQQGGVSRMIFSSYEHLAADKVKPNFVV